MKLLSRGCLAVIVALVILLAYGTAALGDAFAFMGLPLSYTGELNIPETLGPPIDGVYLAIGGDMGSNASFYFGLQIVAYNWTNGTQTGGTNLLTFFAGREMFCSYGPLRPYLLYQLEYSSMILASGSYSDPADASYWAIGAGVGAGVRLKIYPFLAIYGEALCRVGIYTENSTNLSYLSSGYILHAGLTVIF